ncbi:MAG: TonB-dependent receptor [Cyclobacteriaceae bacterium]|nr:TonB-dependent receptor [Cyclobacteriaceae bacterium]
MKTFTNTIITLTALLFLISTSAFTQSTTTISGTVKDSKTSETLAGVNIIVKGKVIGTITDVDGNFNLTVKSPPPMTIQASFIGYSTAEFDITENITSGLDIVLEEVALLGQEVVISASRVEESILKSPVSIEKMGILAIQNTASDDYYKGMANLKGVDVNSSSINFQIVNARGFNSNGNTRFVQLTDGMDTQAPGLNFPIGNLNGPSILDVESMELIPGASSAIYGANAFNGILLVNSKTPFDYQGVSAYVKTGVNHVGANADREPAPMYEFALRYAKSFNNKFAVKANVSYMKAQDWHGTSDFDRNENLNPFPNESSIDNISADRLHYMGDEANLNMNILRFSKTSDKNGDGIITPDEFGWDILATNPPGVFPSGNALAYAESGFLPNHIIAAPSYKEEHIVDYDAENLKANLGLYYRLNDQMELSYYFNYGFGTSVYTGAQRYSLNDFSINQHRLQLRGDNFFVRAYTTREKSGDSYIAEFLTKRINDERFGGDVANFLTEYPIHYLRSIHDQGFSTTDDPSTVTLQNQLTAHQYAIGMMDTNYPLVAGSDEFEAIKKKVLTGVVPYGPKFNDASNMYHAEGQYNFKNQIDFMNLQMGASFRMFELRSNGTIFDDLGGVIVKEYGAYAQATKNVANDNLKLIASLRFDKNQNFAGQFSPKIAAVFTFLENHNLRASFQTGFRNPAMQAQHIDLDIISARLLGGLPKFYEKYQLTTNTYPVTEVNKFTKQIFDTGTLPDDPANVALLTGKEFTNFNTVKPEHVKAMEIGYKSLISNKLMVDMSFYYNIYNDFMTQIQVRKASLLADGTPNYASILRGSALTYISDGVYEGNTAQVYTNIDRQVTAQGATIGLNYSLPKGYTIGGNYNWNVLNEEAELAAEGFVSEYNTPAHKYNITFGNRRLTKNLGFNIAYRWQDAFLWQSSFAQGMVDEFETLDVQVSYKLESLKSMLKLGGSNILGKTYNTSLGGPNIGTIYYVSVTFDQFMN